MPARSEFSKSIPTLLEILQSEEDEWMQLAFIDIFRVMANQGDLRGRQDVADEIRQVVNQMKSYRTKEEAQQSLDEIEKAL